MGRPKGALNKATREIRDAARNLIEDPAYLAGLKIRLEDGKAPHMETLLFHYAYGKPKETVGFEDADGKSMQPCTFLVKARQ